MTGKLGRSAQLSWNLKHKPLCKPSCPSYGKASIHSATCEHGIILAAQKLYNTYCR